MDLRDALRVKRRSRLRTRIKQSRNLRLIGIVQIHKCAAGSNHAIGGKLRRDADIPRVAETI